MPRYVFLVLTLALAAAGCTQFPALDNQGSTAAQTADYPGLLPIDDVLAQRDTLTIGPATVRGLAARALALRAKAAALKRPVIDKSTRARMQAALSRNRA